MSPTVHATCVVVGEAGALIRGRSGAGKSSLAAALVERAEARGWFARLVADDRTRLEPHGGRLVARVPAAIAGLIERRGLGVVAAPHLAAVVVRLVVDIEDAPERWPHADALVVDLEGASIPRLVVRTGDPEAAGLVLFRLAEFASARACVPNALAFAPQHGKMPPATPSAPPVRSDRAGLAPGGLCPERNEFCAETA